MSEQKHPLPPLSQEQVDQLNSAQNMEEFLAIAAQCGIDWNTLDDEWLDAVAQGDVTELIYRMKHKPKTGKKK